MVQHRNPPRALDCDLNSSIRVAPMRISRRLTVPQRVEFCLNAATLSQIEKLSDRNLRLNLSQDNLTNLQHYALLNLSLTTGRSYRSQVKIRPCPALVFATSYSFATDRTPTILMQSVIDPAGKISQQIRQDLTQNPLLLGKISQAHYWLIAEIIAQISPTFKTWLERLILGCMAILLLLLCGLVWFFMPDIFYRKIAVCLGVLFCSRLLFRILLIERLHALIIYHLTEGILANNLLAKRCGLYSAFLLRRLLAYL